MRPQSEVLEVERSAYNFGETSFNLNSVHKGMLSFSFLLGVACRKATQWGTFSPIIIIIIVIIFFTAFGGKMNKL